MRVSVRLLVVGIAPLVSLEVADDGRVSWALLAAEREGVGLVALYPIGAYHDEAVGVSYSHMGEEELPDAVVGALHEVLVLPPHAGRDDKDGLGVRRPHCKARSIDAEHRVGVRSELPVRLVVGPLVEQIAVVVGEESHVPS